MHLVMIGGNDAGISAALPAISAGCYGKTMPNGFEAAFQSFVVRQL